MDIVLIVCSLAVGLLMGFVLNLATLRHLRRRNRELRRALSSGSKPAKVETMKKFVWACVVNGFLWVWCSYVLAAMDKPQIAEELSKVALVEIIAPVMVYAAKSAIENLSRNNRWPDRSEPPADKLTEETSENEGSVGL